MRIAVTGASGLIGSALLPSLSAGGHEVLRLVRRSPSAGDEVAWDPLTKQIDAERLEGLDAVVHLSGENIAAGRWTDAKKARLRSSRVGSTRFLSETLAGLTRKPSVLVSASAVGYYGDRGDTWVGETDPPAADFFGQLSVEWEAAAAHAAHAGIRVVHPRTGIVLSPTEALGMPPFAQRRRQSRLGPAVLQLDRADDVVGVILLCAAIVGLVNSPGAGRRTPATRRVLGRPTIVPVPTFALRIAFGEVADALLASTRMRPERLLATDYRFRFPELERALRHLLSRPA